MSEYTPTTAEIREYVEVGGEPRPWAKPDPHTDEARGAAFDRWLAQVQADALDQAADWLNNPENVSDCDSGERLTGLVRAINELNVRAARIRAGGNR